MKHTITIEVPARTTTVVAFIQCDLCGGKVGENSDHLVDEVEVRHKTGSEYPDCGFGQEVVVDICGACFDKKLVPWLETQGVKPHVKEWSW